MRALVHFDNGLETGLGPRHGPHGLPLHEGSAESGLVDLRPHAGRR
jgi:hypothetical protein